MGRTCLADEDGARTLNIFPDGTSEGCCLGERCMGTYIHGILDNRSVIDALLAPHAARLDSSTALDYEAFKNEQYDKLAAHVRAHLNMPLLYKILQNND